jgi:hypothetical protein
MKTELRLEKPKSVRSSHWGALLGLVFLGTSLSAVLRLYGAIQDQPLLVLYGVPAWKINWLFISSAIVLLSHLIAVIFLWKRWQGLVTVAWLAFAVNLLSYWAERLFVWSSDQNLQGNLWFMVIVFGIYLVLMLLFTLDLKIKVRN